jgi:hypothetical protein
LDGDAPETTKVESFLTRAFSAAAKDTEPMARALVSWICEALLRP